MTIESPARQTLTNSTNLHIREKQLKSIAQRTHVRVRIALQLKPLGNDFDIPALQLGVLPGLEAEEKVAWVFRVDAKGVDGAFGVGHGVGCEPFF